MTKPLNHRLIAQLDRARARIDAASDLLQQAMDIRERLYFGADMDDMRDQVDEFRRDVDAHRR
jgi:hypothetical protein